ncbi:hypothetical protein [Raoultella sp. HC6]|uniref:hypothetical protein n=1 Tax=Raoultella sp. HC6 TaxID=2923366 RepID=UPI001F509A07|nr:hypothetical protein [Raoultella sp. HC6]
MSELTAALATIEKCREITGCPAGVDLQDHLRQLAAENVGLKAAISAVNRTAEECELNGDELKYVVEPSEFEALTDLLDETPATDRIYAGIKADGVEMFALMFAEEAIKDDTIAGSWKAKASRAASEYAELLRQGASE